MDQPKTLAEHHQMLEQTVRLMLGFAHRWALAHPDEALERILIERVDIWRKTHLNRSGLTAKPDASQREWRAMVAGIEAAFRRHSAAREPFVDQAFTVLADSIAARAPEDFRRERDGEHLRQYDCGSLRHDAPSADGPDVVFLHIANALAPRSIFADPAYLPDCLRQVIRKARERHDAERLCTHTWLNSHPSWLRLFPDEWQANLGPEDRDVQWHYGFWGQFLNARGCLNRKLAARFEASGTFPYWPRRSSCSFAALEQHLDDLETAS